MTELEQIQDRYYENLKQKKVLEREIIKQAGSWKKNKVDSLAARQTVIGALSEYSAMTITTAMKSRKVSKELKDSYKLLIAQMKQDSDRADDLVTL